MRTDEDRCPSLSIGNRPGVPIDSSSFILYGPHMAASPPRWIARPVEVEAVVWTGDFQDLPPAWQAHPFIDWDGTGLNVTTVEGDTGYPDVGDFLVWGCASELYWTPPRIHTERWKPLGGIRWIARPVVTEAVLWTGAFADLPDAWQDDPQFQIDPAGLALKNYRGAVTRPRPQLDYIVARNGGKFSKVPRAIWEFKYEPVVAR